MKSIHESIETTSSSGKLIFHIFGALAEFERNLICERTHAGLKAARTIGKMGGRPKKLNAEKAKLVQVLQEMKENSGPDETMKQLEIRTVNHLAELYDSREILTQKLSEYGVKIPSVQPEQEELSSALPMQILIFIIEYYEYYLVLKSNQSNQTLMATDEELSPSLSTSLL